MSATDSMTARTVAALKARGWWPPFGRRRTVVPAIRLGGVIGDVPFRSGGLTAAALAPAIEAAFAVKRAPAVALLVNSPGGSPVQSSLIAGRIRRLAEEKQRPVLAFVEDVAASGGYWLSLAADEIWADPSSIVGSIGVISAGFGFPELLDRLGIERRVHTTGPRKGLLDPFRPEQPGDIAVLREIQDEIYARFKAEVLSRRAGKLAGDHQELFDGRVWTGATAQRLGLIDGLGDARSVIRDRYGKEAVLAVMNRPRGWLRRRLGFGRTPGDVVAEALAVLEERWLWQRYGL